MERTKEKRMHTFQRKSIALDRVESSAGSSNKKTQSSLILNKCE